MLERQLTLVQAGDVRGGRLEQGGLWITAPQDFDEIEFDQVVDLLGVKGVTAFDIDYNFLTGEETWVIDYKLRAVGPLDSPLAVA